MDALTVNIYLIINHCDATMWFWLYDWVFVSLKGIISTKNKSIHKDEKLYKRSRGSVGALVFGEAVIQQWTPVISYRAYQNYEERATSPVFLTQIKLLSWQHMTVWEVGPVLDQASTKSWETRTLNAQDDDCHSLCLTMLKWLDSSKISRHCTWFRYLCSGLGNMNAYTMCV